MGVTTRSRSIENNRLIGQLLWIGWNSISPVNRDKIALRFPRQ
jgi:hypothetical protein